MWSRVYKLHTYPLFVGARSISDIFLVMDVLQSSKPDEHRVMSAVLALAVNRLTDMTSQIVVICTASCDHNT